MQAFNEFSNMEPSFWAFVKFVSEGLGYSNRGSCTVKSYTYSEIRNLCIAKGVRINEQLIQTAVNYTILRANALNNYVERQLMDAQTAMEHFERLYPLYEENHLMCKIPYNKQSGAMKQVAFFTAMINIIAADTIRQLTGNTNSLGFDDDPRGLTYFLDNNQNIIGASSRRFDGAYPSIKNPSIVWEIKEYYYATTFGSRVADGVYETQLDGYEFRDMYNRIEIKPYHILFVDAYRTWWIQGKSYLCRLIDALNSGIVDEVIFGQEIFTRWPQLLIEIIGEGNAF